MNTTDLFEIRLKIYNIPLTIQPTYIKEKTFFPYVLV